MSGWLTWPLRVAALAAWFFWQLVKSNAQVIRDILTRPDRSTPMIVKVDLPDATDVEGALVALMVSLTPGTLVLANEQGPIVLYVHSLYSAHDEVILGVTDLARRVASALRVGGAS